MSLLIRMPRSLRDATLERLRRPHPFAAERVSFAYGRRGKLADGEVVLLARVVDVDDDDYEDDPSVGARINSAAIHKALQHALDLRAAAFHLHLHDHSGTPWFSRVDLHELPGVVRPFGILVPEQPYGLLLLSDDDCVGLVWHRGHGRPRVARDVTLVGSPVSLLRGFDR